MKISSFKKLLVLFILPFTILSCSKKNYNCLEVERKEHPEIKKYLGNDLYNEILNSYFNAFCPNGKLDLSLHINPQLKQNETRIVDVSINDFIFNDVFEKIVSENKEEYYIVSFAHKTLGEWWNYGGINHFYAKKEYDTYVLKYYSLSLPLVYKNGEFVEIYSDFLIENNLIKIEPKYSSFEYSFNLYGENCNEED